MVSLQSFGTVGIPNGELNFLVVFLASLIGGNLFSLYINRNNEEYSAVGASGAVSGVIFSTIMLWPSDEVSLLMIPIFIPGWLFALIFVLFSMFGIKKRLGNVGHYAHLGGALVGVLTTIALRPDIVVDH